MMREDPVIANGTFSNYYLYNSTNKKLKSYGYTEEMPLLLQTTQISENTTAVIKPPLGVKPLFTPQP